MLNERDDLTILEAVLALPAAERAAYLTVVCGSDVAQRQRLERLLREDKGVDPFLRSGGALAGALGEEVAAALERDETLADGTTVGPYRVNEEIGRGGMAVVYRAERVDGTFDHAVAVKVVKRGADTDDLLARFRRERQILATLEHPHIARLLDGGALEDGRPYLVMELVHGQRIDAYANAHALGLEARVDLFLTVARAVRYAHQHFVVHRDLKPSNILVNDAGEAKLLDFGIARLLVPEDQTSAAKDAPTLTVHRRLTPRYASPEQLTGRTVTTATDVYQLGLLLYELVTGQPAHALDGLTPSQAEQVICDVAPLRPSAAAKLTTVPSQWARALKGDLDTIIATAIAKDPHVRYPATDPFIDDLERYQRGLPVRAMPPSLRYRAGKFLRRRRVGVAASLALAAAVVVGTTTTVVQARAAAREGRRAEQIRDYLIGVFRTSDPNDRSGGATVTARELLDRGSARLGQDVTDPGLRADMTSVFGKLYLSLGLFDQAHQHASETLSLRRASRAAPPVVMDAISDLAAVHFERGETDQAEALMNEALAMAQARADRSGTAALLSDVAAVSRARGQYKEGEARYREALAIQRGLGDLPGIAATLNGLGVLLGEAGRPAEAVGALEESLTVERRIHGELHSKVALARCNLAQALHRAARLAPAREEFERCVADRRQLLGDRHPSVGLALNGFGLVHSDLNEYEPARGLFAEALLIQRAAYGPNHREIAATLNNLAIVDFNERQYAAAAERFKELIGVWTMLVGAEHPNTLSTTNNLAMVMRSAGDLAGAEPILRDVLVRRARALGAGHPSVGESHVNLATVLLRQSRFADALDESTKGAAVLAKAYPSGHSQVATAHVIVGRARLGLGRAAAALADFDRALAQREALFGPTHLQTAGARVDRARALKALGRVDEARQAVETALAHLEANKQLSSLTADDARQLLATLPTSRAR